MSESNNELILKYLIEIKGDISGVKEHLKNLNGSVARHEKDIGKNTKSINSIDKRMAKWGGAIGVVILLVQFFIARFV